MHSTIIWGITPHTLVLNESIKAWSGISLWGSDGELHTDFTEGDYEGELKPTKLKSVMPYTYSVIDKIYGDSPKSRVRIMRIAPKSSLVWQYVTDKKKQN